MCMAVVPINSSFKDTWWCRAVWISRLTAESHDCAADIELSDENVSCI